MAVQCSRGTVCTSQHYLNRITNTWEGKTVQREVDLLKLETTKYGAAPHSNQSAS